MLRKLKEWLIKKVIERKVAKMLDSLKAKLEGKKTYLTAGLGILVALAGVLFGPIDLPGGLTIPALSANDLIQVIWTSGLFSFLHAKKS